MEAVTISVLIQPSHSSAAAGQDTLLAQTDNLAQVKTIEQKSIGCGLGVCYVEVGV